MSDLVPDDRSDPRDELAAYLAGDLDEPGSARVAARLAEDPAARRELELLEAAWDALDLLPAVPVGEHFTAATLELVALSAQREAQELAGWRRWLVRALGIAGLAATVGLGFLAARGWSATQEVNAADLALWEDLDALRQIDSVEYLRALRAAGLFRGPPVEEHVDAAPR